MRYQTELFYTDPDYLAEGILIAEFVWDAGGESLNGSYTLANWRDEVKINRLNQAHKGRCFQSRKVVEYVKC